MDNPKWRSLCKNNATKKSFSDIEKYDVNAEKLFPLHIPQFLQESINSNDENDPILLQVLPQKHELDAVKYYSDDPVGDLITTPVKGVIHKYHGRVLLITTGICAVNCRYCFRRNFPYAQNHASKNNWDDALSYIKSNKDINEVILSGGDPLMLSTKVLKKLSNRLEKILHVKTLRIHTRMPIVTPSRITTNFLNWLNNVTLKKVMVVHCNHANELNQHHMPLFKSIAKTNTLLLNQSVLLKNINDDVEVLNNLSHRLFDFGILPYYLNQLDKANGTHHFRVTKKEAISIHKQLLQTLPGYLVPKLVEEISGKMNKSPMF